MMKKSNNTLPCRMRQGSVFNTVDVWGWNLLRLGISAIFIAHGGKYVFGWIGGRDSTPPPSTSSSNSATRWS